jgi:hypothetical protein
LEQINGFFYDDLIVLGTSYIGNHARYPLPIHG